MNPSAELGNDNMQMLSHLQDVEVTARINAGAQATTDLIVAATGKVRSLSASSRSRSDAPQCNSRLPMEEGTGAQAEPHSLSM